MKTNKKAQNILAVAILPILATPLISFAQINTALEIEAETAAYNLGASEKDQSEAIVAADINLNTSIAIEAEADGSIKAEGAAAFEALEDLQVAVEVEAEPQTEEDAVNKSFPLAVNSAGITVSSSREVETDADLVVFTKNHLVNNPSVSKIETESEDEVSVTHKQRLMIFGLIPVVAKTRTTVIIPAGSKAVAAVSAPWWSFLAGGSINSSTLTKSIEGNLNIQLGNSAMMKAQAIEQVTTEITAHTTIQTSARNQE